MLDGQVELSVEGRANELDEEGYAFVRADQDRRITAQAAARLAVLERPCAPLAGQSAPRLHIANCKELTAAPIKGNDMLMLKELLPEELAFDCEVNVMDFPPAPHCPASKPISWNTDCSF